VAKEELMEKRFSYHFFVTFEVGLHDRHAGRVYGWER
jgi:hypothetical protein